MPKFIAHRGNLTGPNPEKENNPDYVYEAIKQGFDVEVDVWKKDDKWWLGHDKPQYEVDFSFLQQPQVWCHAKNFETYRVLQNHYSVNAFMQSNEVYVTTTRGYMWWHEDQRPFSDMNRSYCVLTALSVQDGEWLPEGYHGLCTDYAQYCRDGKPTFITQPAKATWLDAYEVKETFDKALEESAKMLNPFDILFIDVDGVLAASKIYDRSHRVIGKTFCDRDFTAIKRMKAAGTNIVILSGDDWNSGMAKIRKIEFIWTPAKDGIIDKKPYAVRYALDKGVPVDRLAYIGDDFYDIPALEWVRNSFCPYDSPRAVKDITRYVLNSYGGEGCIAEIYDKFEWNEQYPYDHL